MKKDIIVVICLLLLVVGGSLGIYYLDTKKETDIKKDNVEEKEVGEKVVGHVYRVGYLSQFEMESLDKIISDYEDFKKYFTNNTNYRFDGKGNIISSTTDEILEKYDEEFFKDKSLAVQYLPMTSGSDTLEDVYGLVYKNKVTIKYIVNYPEVGTADMSGFFIIVEVPKEVEKIIKI